MYLGVIFKEKSYSRTVTINANDKNVAKRKLDAYIEFLNSEGMSNFTAEFVDTDEVEMIAKLHY